MIDPLLHSLGLIITNKQSSLVQIGDLLNYLCILLANLFIYQIIAVYDY